MKKFYFIFVLMFAICSQTFAQERTLTGTLTDMTTGDALVGANIHIPNTNISSTTNMKGEYKITVPDSTSMLSFSFIGYKRQLVKLDSDLNNNVLNLTLVGNGETPPMEVVTPEPDMGIEKAKKDAEKEMKDAEKAANQKAKDAEKAAKKEAEKVKQAGKAKNAPSNNTTTTTTTTTTNNTVTNVSGGDRTISGTLTDAVTNEPLVGANISIPGTTIGTTTDFDGMYSLDIPEGYDRLSYSFISYKRQLVDITNNASNVININLEEDVMNLDAFVTTAVGITREKKALGYAVEQISGDELLQAKQTNVVNALAGKVAGVQVVSSSGAAGSSAYIRIRGSNTIQGNNQPLFVVDGIPIDNSQLSSGNPDDGANGYLSGVSNSNRAIDIPQEDIESVSLLKGAAATALYGSQAGNGALIITTIKGK